MNTNAEVKIKEYYKDRYFKGSKLSFKMNDCKGLDAGGNGEVLSIVTEDLEGDYVVKFLKPSFLADKTRKERFIRECKKTKTINKIFSNKYVIPIIDTCDLTTVEDADVLWFVMPRAELMFKYLKGKSPLVKIQYMINLGNAIAALHDEGYQHRDIKPNNILFYDGSICLGDLGLVYDTNECDYTLTRVGDIIGPLNYRPPEMTIGSVDDLKMDMKPVDVYEYAKTVWAFLREEKRAFPGHYDRFEFPTAALSEGTIANFFADNILTIGDLHSFMTAATEDMPDRRPNIVECIQILKNWLINYNNTEIAQLQRLENLGNELLQMHQPQIIEFVNENGNLESIIEIILKISKEFAIILPKIGNFNVETCSLALSDGCLEFGGVIRNNNVKLILKPEKVIVDRGKGSGLVCQMQVLNIPEDSLNMDNLVDLMSLDILPNMILEEDKEYIIKDAIELAFCSKSKS